MIISLRLSVASL